MIADRYRLDALVGEGGMSRVFAAHDLVEKRTVALKMVSFDRGDKAQLEGRFRREIEVALQLTGPSFVPVYDHGVNADCAYLAMELLEGESLQSRLSRVGRLEAGALLDLVRGIGAGLGAAHELCIVHRDLKPSNIFLARTGDTEVVRILDFGIAKDMWTASKLTHAGALLGSPHYVSPEQAKATEVDHRSDLWSLGVILYRAITGAKPFEGNLSRLVVRIVTEKHTPPTKLVAGLIPAWDAFFDRALAKKPEDRFPNIAAMVTAAETVVASQRARAEAQNARTTRRQLRSRPSRPDPAETNGVEAEPLSERTQMAAASYESYVAMASDDRISHHPTVEVASPLLARADMSAMGTPVPRQPTPAPPPPVALPEPLDVRATAGLRRVMMPLPRASHTPGSKMTDSEILALPSVLGPEAETPEVSQPALVAATARPHRLPLPTIPQEPIAPLEMPAPVEKPEAAAPSKPGSDNPFTQRRSIVIAAIVAGIILGLVILLAINR
ncbi:MAG: serine/threonine protein kinase [Polyangiaceae bacterium]|nr:serine/threonine protein kinase [Polyangiaceae bacterium]